jgi:hypothetical protein
VGISAVKLRVTVPEVAETGNSEAKGADCQPPLLGQVEAPQLWVLVWESGVEALVFASIKNQAGRLSVPNGSLVRLNSGTAKAGSEVLSSSA